MIHGQHNRNLSYGFLTGILRIAQESIFSGLNNLNVNSIMDRECDKFFGFTGQEVHEMLEYYGVADKENELKNWYDGYLFGEEEIYNPWSVINYVSKNCVPQAYWVNTGKNEVLEDVAESLYVGDFAKLQKAIAEYMDKSISFYDGGSEGFYHGLILGLIALMDTQYKIKSNRESGDGRYDISLFPKLPKYPGIIMEFKWGSNLDANTLDELAEEALRQIDEKRYDSEMKEMDASDILKLGIAFSGKKVNIRTKITK